MGRKDKKRYKVPTVISELEERERIKQSILQVFRKRVSSPGGGGAILIGKDTKKTNQSNSQVLDHVTYESTSSMTDSEASTSPGQKTQKRRRRKKRQKTQRKVKRVETDRHDVAKHLKIAHDTRQILRPSGDNSTVSLISQNRLTRKMGLFNRGKKSSTISRDIYVPDAVKKKTQEDLKKILQHSDSDDEGDYINHTEPQDIRISPLILPKPSNGPVMAINVNKKSDLGYHSSRSNPITPSSPKTKTTMSSTSCISNASSDDGVQNILPEEPEMEDISDVLVKKLNLRQFFLGRNLFEETVEDLRKIMKHNSFPSTPVSKHLRSTDVDSVKRSLLDRYSPTKPQDNLQTKCVPSNIRSEATYTTVQSTHKDQYMGGKELIGEKSLLDRQEVIGGKSLLDRQDLIGGKCLLDRQEVIGGKSLLDRQDLIGGKSLLDRQDLIGGNSLLDRQDLIGGKSLLDRQELIGGKSLFKCQKDVMHSRSSNTKDGLLSILSQSPKQSCGKDFLDGKMMLKYNNIQSHPRSSSSKSSSSLSQSPPMLNTKTLVDGKTLLKCNDDMLIAETCHQMEQLSSKPQPMEMDLQGGNALKLLEHNEKVKLQTVSYHGNTIREIQRDILCLLPNDLDITHQSSQSSGYHGSQNSRYINEDYTSRRIVDDSMASVQGTEYMPQFHTHTSDNLQNKENDYESMDILDYLDGSQPEPKIRKVITTSSDSVPMWLPSNVHVIILPKKPTFESPSPEKLRPRFMH